MTPERYQRVVELFHAALELKPEARPAFLTQTCASDEELRQADTKSTSTESVERALIQMERDWADAIVKHDAAAISRIVAEDWSETSWDGQSFGKAQALADLPLGTTESITMDPIKVRVFGDVAIVTAGDAEKEHLPRQGQQWPLRLDRCLYERNGQWQVVATQVSKVPPSKL